MRKFQKLLLVISFATSCVTTTTPPTYQKMGLFHYCAQEDIPVTYINDVEQYGGAVADALVPFAKLGLVNLRTKEASFAFQLETYERYPWLAQLNWSTATRDPVSGLYKLKAAAGPQAFAHTQNNPTVVYVCTEQSCTRLEKRQGQYFHINIPNMDAAPFFNEVVEKTFALKVIVEC